MMPSLYLNTSVDADASSETQGRRFPNQRPTCTQPTRQKLVTVTSQSWWNYRSASGKCRQEPHRSPISGSGKWKIPILGAAMGLCLVGFLIWWGSASASPMHWYRTGKCAPSTTVVHGSLQVLQRPQRWQGLAFAWQCQDTEGSGLEAGGGVLLFCNSQLVTTTLTFRCNFFSIKTKELVGVLMSGSWLVLWWDMTSNTFGLEICSVARWNLRVLEIPCCVLLWILHSS